MEALTINKRRILVVEDIDNLRATYVNIVSQIPNSEIATAGTRDDAIRLVEHKTFHLALVDIALAQDEDPGDSSGFDVIDRIQKLNEGTVVIVLSGREEAEIPVKAFVDYRDVVYTYLMKQKLSSPQDIIEPINDALTTSLGLKPYGRYRSMVDYLAIGYGGEMFWVEEGLRILKPLDGWAGLNAFTSLFCHPLAPLLPRKGSRFVSHFDRVKEVMYANLWSKALASEVFIYARHSVGKNDVPPPVPEVPARMVWHFNKAFVDGWVYIPDESSSRQSFLASLKEVFAL